ncbi:MAG: glycosyltransferase [Bacteroidetes bacterium]|nr:MAG: glycosyltransferase [Bacteroidota bacterium]
MKSGNKKILMLLPNGFDPDPRVYKEAKTLVSNGYSVLILAWDREAKYPLLDQIDGIQVKRIPIRSTYGRGTRQLLFLILYWFRAFYVAMKLDFDIIHCHDFLTLPLGFLIAKLKSKKIIFDAHESYSEMLGENIFGVLKKLIYLLENIIIKRIDLLITVGEILESEYQKRGAVKTRVVGNWKAVEDFKIEPELIEAEKNRIGIPKGHLVISFLGFLHHDRKIIPLIKAVKQCKDIFLILGGMGAQENDIRKAIKGCSNIIFIGRYKPDKIPLYTNISDIIYYVLDSNNPNAKYSAPNKLFEALAAGKAILCGDHGEIAKIVREEQCGWILKPQEEENLNVVLQEISQNGKVTEFKTRAFQAGRSKYNWNKAAQTLLQSYRTL